ncbi:hypothetical protein FXO38_12882 [Capsicum annuum]|nr:hypothetical protein FXO38_12882 [Capsicum annuum]KAF3661843.1 hypothetical protein FXO37_12760 [Capsicum annuum]
MSPHFPLPLPAHINNSDITVNSKISALITKLNGNNEGNLKDPPPSFFPTINNPPFKVKTVFPPSLSLDNSNLSCDNDKPSSIQPGLKLNTTHLGSLANLMARDVPISSRNSTKTHSGRQVNLDHNTEPLLPCPTSNRGSEPRTCNKWPNFHNVKDHNTGKPGNLTSELINMELYSISQCLPFFPLKIPGMLEIGPIFAQSYGVPPSTPR